MGTLREARECCAELGLDMSRECDEAYVWRQAAIAWREVAKFTRPMPEPAEPEASA